MASPFDIETDSIEFENLAKLAENLVYLLPGCTDLMVRKTLQDVYRDFCRRSCCLVSRRRIEVSEPKAAICGKYGGVVDCVTAVKCGHRLLRQGRDYSVTKDNGMVEIEFSPRMFGWNHHFPWSPDHHHHHHHMVVEVDAIELPGITSEQVPAGFIDQYGEILCDGVLGRLMIMTGRPWSDPQQAAMRNLRYENGINDVRVRFYTDSQAGNGETWSCVDPSYLL